MNLLNKLTNNFIYTFTFVLSLFGMLFWLYAIYLSLSAGVEANIVFAFLGYTYSSAMFWKYGHLVFKQKNDLIDSWN